MGSMLLSGIFVSLFSNSSSLIVPSIFVYESKYRNFVDPLLVMISSKNTDAGLA
jgi:hypothetical protein